MKNFDSNTREEDLSKIFEEFGQIISVKIATDALGNSKCFGYVCFKESAQAVEAIKHLDSKNGLYVAFHKNKQVRQ